MVRCEPCLLDLCHSSLGRLNAAVNEVGSFAQQAVYSSVLFACQSTIQSGEQCDGLSSVGQKALDCFGHGDNIHSAAVSAHCIQP